MFTYLNKQGVESDKGFVVQFVGRFEVEYREAQKVISVYVEPGYTADNRFCVSIEPNSFTHWSDGTPINSTQQKDILKNFIEAMEFQNIVAVVE